MATILSRVASHVSTLYEKLMLRDTDRLQ